MIYPHSSSSEISYISSKLFQQKEKKKVPEEKCKCLSKMVSMLKNLGASTMMEILILFELFINKNDFYVSVTDLNKQFTKSLIFIEK